MSATASTDSIGLPRNLEWKHLWIYLSAICVWLSPGFILMLGMERFVFRFDPHVPLRTYTNAPAFAATSVAVLVVCLGSGKYIWLAIMSRFVRKCDVLPWISYGIPRRISRFDERLLNKWFRKEEAGTRAEVVRKTGLTAREAIMLTGFNIFLAGFFTTQLGPAYYYPKQIWAEWLLVLILVLFVCAAWSLSIYMIIFTLRLRRKKSCEPTADNHRNGDSISD